MKKKKHDFVSGLTPSHFSRTEASLRFQRRILQITFASSERKWMTSGVPSINSGFQPLFPLTPPIPHPIEALERGIDLDQFAVNSRIERDKRFYDILKPQNEPIPKHFPLKPDHFAPGLDLLSRKKMMHSPDPSPLDDKDDEPSKRRRLSSPQRSLDNDSVPIPQRPEPMVYGKIINDIPHQGPTSISVGPPPIYAVVGDHMHQGMHNPAQFADMFMPHHYQTEGVGGF